MKSFQYSEPSSMPDIVPVKSKNMRKIFIAVEAAIILLAVIFLAFPNLTSLFSNNQQTAGASNVVSNLFGTGGSANKDYTVVTLEDWDERDATIDSDGNLIYKRDGSLYARNLETNEEKNISANNLATNSGAKATHNIFIVDLSKNITIVDCQNYKSISYYGEGHAEGIDTTGCISVDGKKAAFLADGWEGNNKGVYKSLYYYDLDSKKLQKVVSDGRMVKIVGWTNNNEIVFHENTRDVDFVSPVTSKLFYFGINENKKYDVEGTESDWSFSVSPDGSKALLIGVSNRIYDFTTKNAKPISPGVFSDSGKEVASLSGDSIIIYKTEDGSQKTLNYKARENHMQRLVWYKDKIYIIVFAPLVSMNSYKGGDTDYGTVSASFNGKPPTVRYTDMKVGETAEISVTVTSKINNAAVLVEFKEPRTETSFSEYSGKWAYKILESPKEVNESGGSKRGSFKSGSSIYYNGDRTYDNDLTAGWSKTYKWKISPDGNLTDVYAPIDVEVEFMNHEQKYMINNDKYRRKIYFTIANPYIIK